MKQFGPAWLWLAIGILLLGGCSRGPRTYPVTGSVKMDGQALAGAQVVFADPSHRHAAVGMTDATGNFALAYVGKVGAPEGSFKVSISKQGPSPEVEGLRIELVPARYNKATTLTAQVQKGGSNAFAFDHLTSEKDQLDQRGPPVKPNDDDVPIPDAGGTKSPVPEKRDPLLDQLDRPQGRDEGRGG